MTSALPTAASPAIRFCAPCPAGTASGAQVAPPSLLSQAALVRTVTVRCFLPVVVVVVVVTSPAIRIRFPATAAYLMSSTRPPGLAVRPSCAAPSRSQSMPLTDRKITGLDFAWSPFGTFAPAAMKPPAVRFSTLIWSPGCSGRPDCEISVHDTPLPLVQIESGPTATHAPWPPATKRAACPGGGGPPPDACSVPMVQERPPFLDTKNCALASRAPVCEPTATTSAPLLVTRPRVWVMPRSFGAAVNWLPARVAGGKPRDEVSGVGPGLPLLAFASTTTATPSTTMARIGTATLVPQPRN